MDLAEELDDEAMSDGAEDELTTEDYERLEEGLEQIRNMIGSEAQSGITDDEIKDTLWNAYYDVEASLNSILVNKPLPELPVEEAEFISPPQAVIPHMRALALDEGSHIITLDPDGDEEFYYEVEQEGMEPFRTLKKPSLTTISERSEHTEDTHDYARQGRQTSLRRESSKLSFGSTTDYGQVIEKPSLLDPNTIPPSPTFSALQRLSIPESPPSASSTGSRTPIAQLTPLPDEEIAEEIAVTPRMQPQILEKHSPVTGPPRDLKGKARSKLSSLASSRSGASSRTTGTYTVDSGSVLTYPPLRPGSQSDLSLLTESSVTESTATGNSSMSSHVRRALETALKMEELDALSPFPPAAVNRPSAPIPEGPSTSSGTPAGPISSPPGETRSRPTSKLSQLAQKRAVHPGTNTPPIEVVPPSSASAMSDHKPDSTLSKLSQRARDVPKPSAPRASSKLSQLAQNKAQQGESTVSSDSMSQTSSTAKPTSKLAQLAHMKAAQTTSLPSHTDVGSTSTQSSPASRPRSKLAQLAQARAQQSATQTAPLDITTPKTPDPSVAPSEPSKLAQAKAHQSNQSHWMPPKRTAPAPLPGLTVHKSHTEYVTPIANGPTATTAITTTYQSLSDLGRPQRTEPATRSMHMFAPKHEKAGAEPKQSKLAMKSKRAHKQVEEVELEPAAIPLDPIFSPSSPYSLAQPSAFGSLLVHDETLVEETRPSTGKESHNTSRHREHRRRSSRRHEVPLPPTTAIPVQTFAFDIPSPDDVVFNARRGTSLGQRPSNRSSPAASAHPSRASVATAKEREKAEKAEKLAQQKKAAEASARLPGTPSSAKKGGQKRSGTSTPVRPTDAGQLDLAGLNLDSPEPRSPIVDEPPPKITVSREKVLEEARKALEGKDEKKGSSPMLKRPLMDEKKRIANERASSKIGKSSFSWAWEFDGTTEERERGITMDIALQTMATPHRHITILDAPGHKDFIPNMISGAAQADCALLVVDAATGEFEAGFERGGQTREHLLLVRSLGVSQVVIAVNKLDQVQWDQDRYEEICSTLRPFLLQSGFHPSKTKFVPVGAMAGINLVNRDDPDAAALCRWYTGPTLVDLLDELEPPTRDITAPLRFPISNVFRGQTSGIAVSGRVCSGLVQVGERLRVLPGDETALVKSIEAETEFLTWAAAGQNVTLVLTAVDPVHLNIGTVLCPPSDIIPLAMSFTARIIVFDIQVPITAGASVELFHQSRDVPASISRLVATIDRATVYSQRALQLKSKLLSGVPLNKEMGRILIRRGGETIAAGIVLEITSNGNGT
ncbi:hypothetical protein EIP86_011359 [Pleurotus ostreatoroseus]|nr:hypothetical protein EIP86_011359 [Pleurotus ostreatoroseus]